MSSKPTVSKAGPLSADLKAIVMTVVVAVIPMALFGVMGLGIAQLATGAAMF